MLRKSLLAAAFVAAALIPGAAAAIDAPAVEPVGATAETRIAAKADDMRLVRKYLGMPQYGASCIDHGQTCTLNGTPCCDPYDCKGSFPNTTCK
ncbi:MAG: hypothetical protein KDJ16_07855 [Hyphomicrobiales bacterium]|nr:hypothetical protein [Hyphomicrobiales bacterium]